MKNKNILLTFAGLFLMVILSRWVSHLWNFTLVGGAFLFAGSYFQDKKVSVGLMLASMLVSDAVIGFHDQMLSVYLGYLIVIGLGVLIGQMPSRLKVLSYSFAGTFAFYVITNLAVWYEGKLYPLNTSGLIDCFVLAIPFYKNQLISDVASSLMFFELSRVVSVRSTNSAKI